MANTVDVGDAKRQFSELMNRVILRRERFLIRRHGKPVVALVSVEDLQRLEEQPEAPRGLLAAAGAWADFDDLDTVIEDIYRQRSQAQDRPVVFEG